MSTLSSTAHVATDRAERYAKQLGEHLGRKVPVVDSDRGRVVQLGEATCLLAVTDEALVLEASAPDTEAMERVHRVVGGHLERFGVRDELLVTWS